MPLMMTFFNVRKGVLRDTMFKRGMRHFFPQRAREYEARGDFLVDVVHRDVDKPPRRP